MGGSFQKPQGCDGSQTLRHLLRTGIETIAQARPIFRQLVIWIGEQGLRYNDSDLQVKLVDAKKLTMRRSGKKRVALWHDLSLQ